MTALICLLIVAVPVSLFSDRDDDATVTRAPSIPATHPACCPARIVAAIAGEFCATSFPRAFSGAKGLRWESEMLRSLRDLARERSKELAGDSSG